MIKRPGKTQNENKYYKLTCVIMSLLLTFFTIMSTLIVTQTAYASELDDFETAATGEDSKQKTDDDQNSEDQKHSKHHGKEHDDHEGGFFEEFFGDIFLAIFEGAFDLVCDGIEMGTKMSYARVDGETDLDPAQIELRQKGEPTLPYCQVDYKYMRVNSDIKANDLGLELGNGPVGFEFRNTYFNEISPKDDLTLNQYHLLLRMSPNRAMEFGIGAGLCDISGNEDNSGFSLTFPIKCYLNKSFGIKFKPAYSWINGNTIDDTDISLAFTKKFGTIELGYRFLETNGVDLDGAYIGFAYHY